MTRATCIALLLTACGERETVEFSFATPARLAQSSADFDNLTASVRVYAASGTTSFPSSSQPLVNRPIPIEDQVVTVRVLLDPGSYWAEAGYREQQDGSDEILPVLRQFTIEPFELKRGATTTVDLFENETTDFDFDGDGVTNLAELESGTDPESKESFDCVENPCAPVVVASSVPEPAEMVAHGDNLYLLESPASGAGSLRRVVIATGALELLASTRATPFGLQVDDDRLFWADLPVGPVTPTPQLWIAPLPFATANSIEIEYMKDFTIEGSSVYYWSSITIEQFDFLGMGLDGTPFANPLTTTQPGTGVLTFLDDGTDLLWHWSQPGGCPVFSVALSAENVDVPTTEAHTSCNARDVQADTTQVIWADGNAIYRQDRTLASGNHVQVVADDQAVNVFDLHRDGGVYYWVREVSGSDTVELVTWDATDVTVPLVLHTDPTGELRISAADDHRIYWWSTNGDLISLGKRGT